MWETHMICVNYIYLYSDIASQGVHLGELLGDVVQELTLDRHSQEVGRPNTMHHLRWKASKATRRSLQVVRRWCFEEIGWKVERSSCENLGRCNGKDTCSLTAGSILTWTILRRIRRQQNVHCLMFDIMRHDLMDMHGWMNNLQGAYFAWVELLILHGGA